MRPAPSPLRSQPAPASIRPPVLAVAGVIPRRRRPARSTLLALLFTPLAGCFGLCTPDPPDPCDLDPLGCGGPSHLEVDPACPLVGDLTVALGEGEFDLQVLTAGERPTLHHGGQGGVHLALGVRVDDPATAYPGLEIAFSARVGPCEVDDLECVWTDLGARRLVVTDADLWTITDGALETTGYIVVLDGDPEWYGDGGEARAVLRAEVKDRCGRVGVAVHDYLVGSGGTGSGTDSDSEGGSGSSGSTG